MQSAKKPWADETKNTPRKASGRRPSDSSSLPELPPHLLIQRVLGEGGTATVYQALHTRLKVPVAVKVLARLDEHEEEARERLLREAELCARLSDPRFPRVYDVDQLPDGTPYVVMEHIAGRNLAELIAAGPLDIDTACAITREVLEALIEIHDVGIIHRDIKPGNIILEDGDGRGELKVRVVDFGIAKSMTPLTTSPTQLTQQGAMVGTPHYMAPEQIRGQPLDPRVDLYAVGVMLYEMLTGKVAFDGETVGEVIAATLRDQPEPLHVLRPDVPPALEDFVSRAMARERGNRFSSAHDMLRALHDVRFIPPTEDTVSLADPARDTQVEPTPASAMPFADEVTSGLVNIEHRVLRTEQPERPALLIMPDADLFDDVGVEPSPTYLRDTVRHPMPDRAFRMVRAALVLVILTVVFWPEKLHDDDVLRVPPSSTTGSTPGAAPTAPPPAPSEPATSSPSAAEPLVLPLEEDAEEEATEPREDGRSRREGSRRSRGERPSTNDVVMDRYLEELRQLSVPPPRANPPPSPEVPSAPSPSVPPENPYDPPPTENAPPVRKPNGALPENPYD